MEVLPKCANFRNRMSNGDDGKNKQITQLKIELNEEFYYDFNLLNSLLDYADVLGLTDKEKQILKNEINQRTQNAIQNGDCIKFLRTIYNSSLFDLQNCLPEALKPETRFGQDGIPEKYKQGLVELFKNFRNMSLKEKIDLLKKPGTWEIQEKGRYIIGYIPLNPDSYREDDSFKVFYRDLEKNKLYSALGLLYEIIERKQSQQK